MSTAVRRAISVSGHPEDYREGFMDKTPAKLVSSRTATGEGGCSGRIAFVLQEHLPSSKGGLCEDPHDRVQRGCEEGL